MTAVVQLCAGDCGAYVAARPGRRPRLLWCRRCGGTAETVNDEANDDASDDDDSDTSSAPATPRTLPQTRTDCARCAATVDVPPWVAQPLCPRCRRRA